MQYTDLVFWSKQRGQCRTIGLVCVFILTLLSVTRSQEPTFSELSLGLNTPTAKHAFEKILKGDLSGALRYLDEQISKNKDVSEAFHLRANVKVRMKDYKGALEDITLSINANPVPHQAYLFRSRLSSFFLNNRELAIEDVNEAEKRGYPRAWALSEKASVEVRAKRFDDAVKYHREAIKAQPDTIAFAVQLAWLFVQLNEFQAAVAMLEAETDAYVLRRNGQLPRVKGEKVIKNSDLPGVGRHTVQQTVFNSMEEGRKFNEMNDMSRAFAEALALLGSLFERIGNSQKALIHLQRAIDVDPNYDNAMATKGTILLNNKETNAAIDELTKAIKIADVPLYYFQRCIAYAVLGDEKRSRKDFETYIKLVPDGRAELERKLAEMRSK